MSPYLHPVMAVCPGICRDPDPRRVPIMSWRSLCPVGPGQKSAGRVGPGQNFAGLSRPVPAYTHVKRRVLK